METNNIFEVRGLLCSYSKKKLPGGIATAQSNADVVLAVRQLTVAPGEVVFFVGPSGVGKSTLLETLGFMNDTLVACDTFRYKGRDALSLWKLSDRRMSAFRSNEFSFIFQQNNLMENFSCYENIMITSLLQGAPFDKVRRDTRALVEQIGLPVEDRPIVQYSGGQRQRISFARAILPGFSVLFADEPTGNLDPVLARQLMEILKDKVRERAASAIIVSHDMRLAVSYADKIVRISKQTRPADGTTYGLIADECVFVKDGDAWSGQGRRLTPAQLQDELVSDMK